MGPLNWLSLSEAGVPKAELKPGRHVSEVVCLLMMIQVASLWSSWTLVKFYLSAGLMWKGG